MNEIHSLTVSGVLRETADSLHLTLEVPAESQHQFKFLPGQHLPIQVTVDGRVLRRTYSICSAPGATPLELGIRIQPGGKVSEFLAANLKNGDKLNVMRPSGRFYIEPKSADIKNYLLFAAGSGVTPILSICSALLSLEPLSRVMLFYGNRKQSTAMFIDDLYALKNRFPERLQLAFLFSQEEQEFDIFSGRLDEERVRELVGRFCVGLSPDEAFVCGPDTMIESVAAALSDSGIEPKDIHSERYGAPRQKGTPTPDDVQENAHDVSVTIIMDGHKKNFTMSSEGAAIVDAAAQQGLELPYSCKGGVCATCRTHLREGSVRMDVNYGLEPWEIEKGFVLACQSHPTSNTVMLDYDKT